MARVVAPVEEILITDRVDPLLRDGAVGAVAFEVAGLALVRRVLRDRRAVEGGQEVHVRQARRGEAAQVLGAVRAAKAEGREGAAQALGHALVRRGEVAHVQLVEHSVLGRGERGLLDVLPGGRLQVIIV